MHNIIRSTQGAMAYEDAKPDGLQELLPNVSGSGMVWGTLKLTSRKFNFFPFGLRCVGRIPTNSTKISVTLSVI